MIEKLTIKTKQKKPNAQLASVMGNLGFSKISYLKNTLTVEKVVGYDLKGNPELDYRVVFSPSNIELEYELGKKNKTTRLLSLMPVFLNVLKLSEDYYDVKPSDIYPEVNETLNEAMKFVGKDAVELSTELSETKAKYRSINAKYEDLLKSSEANARILLECERKRDELAKKVERLETHSDDVIKEMVYEWIKLHGGKINIMEFSKINRVPIPRVEDGLNMLVTEGYVKRRFD